MSCRACGNSNDWCRVYTGCPQNKGKEHILKSDTRKPRNWISLNQEPPPENVVVNTINSTGQITRLKRIGRLWWFEDGSMYVYYVPQFWQTIEEA